jgi:serine/threonine protein kinase
MLARVTRSSGQPEVFGKYHLLERIAVGGMAEVYRARAYGTAGFEKILVIKKVLDHLMADEEFKRLFIDEAKIAESLHHVNIVQVWALGEIDGHYFMEMEYVHGLDLSRLVSRARNLGPFPVELALFIAAEVLKALQFAHSRTDATGTPMRIVHCDISPQNILVSYSGEVKITDGSRAFRSHTRSSRQYAYTRAPRGRRQMPTGRPRICRHLGVVAGRSPATACSRPVRATRRSRACAAPTSRRRGSTARTTSRRSWKPSC